MVDADGTIRVYDPVAGYYTRCHDLPVTAQLRACRLAGLTVADLVARA